jgi:hypothetical protein
MLKSKGSSCFANEKASIRTSLPSLSFHGVGFAAALTLLLLVVAGGGVGHGRFVSSDDDVTHFGVSSASIPEASASFSEASASLSEDVTRE